jgi:hypothetical protein
MGIFFPKVMALVYTFSRDPSTLAFVRRTLSGVHEVAAARTWGRLSDALRERPVSLCVVDLAGVGLSGGARAQLVALRGRFPSMAFVIIESRSVAPRQLLDLGRLGFRSLVLPGGEGQEW